MTQRGQIGIRTVRLAFSGQDRIAVSVAHAVPKAEVVGTLEQCRVVDVSQNERWMSLRTAPNPPARTVGHTASNIACLPAASPS